MVLVAVPADIHDGRASSGEPFWTLHCAFRDPTRPDNAPGRESIETRGICLFY